MVSSHTKNMHPSPKELDDQSSIKIDRWIDIDSEEWNQMDDDPAFTKKCLRLGFEEPAFLFTDTNGRIWGVGENNTYYPFHFEHNNKLIGFRMSKSASN